MIIRLLALFSLTIPAISGCGTSTEPEEVVTDHQSISVASQQNVSVATHQPPLPVLTREAQKMSLEETQKYFRRLPTPLGPVPTLQEAFAAIQSSSNDSNMGDLVENYLRAVAQLPIEQQQGARQRLKDYLVNAKNSK
jgi:hypothetical protein